MILTDEETNPFVIAMSIGVELETLGIKPVRIDHGYKEDYVNIIFKTLDDMNLYKIAGRIRNHKWVPNISCEYI